jgi:GntR family transcriptional regulator
MSGARDPENPGSQLKPNEQRNWHGDGHRSPRASRPPSHLVRLRIGPGTHHARSYLGRRNVSTGGQISTGHEDLHARASRSTITRTMCPIAIDRSDPLPLHEQVAAEIRRAIADGEAEPGDRLPLARDLAAVLGVNRNTVLRALHILRDEGLLEFRRGHGIKVTGTKERSDLLTQVHDLVSSARRSGYRKSELIAMIEAVK